MRLAIIFSALIIAEAIRPDFRIKDTVVENVWIGFFVVTATLAIAADLKELFF